MRLEEDSRAKQAMGHMTHRPIICSDPGMKGRDGEKK